MEITNVIIEKCLETLHAVGCVDACMDECMAACMAACVDASMTSL